MDDPDSSKSYVGHEKLVALFGRWPTFHDAEVLSFELQRDEGRPFTSPVCSVIVIVPPFSEPGAPGEAAGAAVLLRFFDGHDLIWKSFNHRNPILGLRIVPCDPSAKGYPLPSHIHDVTFLPVHDLNFVASFTCSRVEVVSVSAAGA